MSRKRNKPGQLDRFQQDRAQRNAINAGWLNPATGLKEIPPPFLFCPLHLRATPSGRVFDRETVMRAMSKYPNPVPPSKQNSANARRSAGWFA